MFDEVKFPMDCPNCKNKIVWFQTKEMGKGLGIYKYEELPHGTTFYTECSQCGMWISLRKNETWFKNKNKT